MSKNTRIYLGIIIFSLLLFIPFLGQVHLFDWDEINFAEAAREMLVTGNYSVVQINYTPFFEKPPLYFWLQAISMNIFGVSEFAARLPNAIVGVLSLLLIFHIGKKYYNTKFGLIWVLSYAGSILPFFYFKTGIIDPLFNMFIFLGIYFATKYLDKSECKNKWHLAFSGLFIGLGILTKGPVALMLLLLILGVYFLITKFREFPSVIDFIIFFTSVILSGGSWFVVEYIRGNEEVIYQFIQVQIDLLSKNVAGHEQPWYYHTIVLTIGVFPAAILAMKSLGKSNEDTEKQHHLSLMLQITFWVVLIVFSSVKTKIVHYSSMTYFSLSFLAAHTVYYLINNKIKWNRWMTISLSIIGVFWSTLMLIFPIIGMNADKIKELSIIGDKFAKANMDAIVNWTGFEGIIGIFLLLTLIYTLYSKTINIGYRMLMLNVGVLITIFTFSAIVTPKIEKYTQGAAIEFFEKFRDDSAYVTPLGYKSYAYLFYSDKQPQKNINHSNVDWLLNGEIDKPAYFISKITQKKQILSKYKKLELIGEKNGFVFYKRKNNK